MDNYSQKSFTLIELLVVIAIVGILAGIIIVSIAGTTDSARIAKAKVFANSMRDSMGNNIVSEWKFDGSGVADGATATADYAKDTWGSDDGTINGNPLVRSGSSCVYGSCLSFDGTDDYIENNFSISGIMTISLWFKTASTTRGMLISKLSQVSTNMGFYIDINNTAGIIRYVSYDNSGTSRSVASPKPLADNTWHHLVIVYDGTNNTMYIDGTKQVSGVAIVPGQSVLSFRIGSSWNTGTYMYNGMLDDIRFYNSALSSMQINSIYTAGLKELFASKQITEDDYSQRLAKVNNFCLTDKKYE